ncbi:hypothetical protein SFRURICE_007272 [Spodoptera frugiperda]|nr:hypothetical protein SFRURICE_007272 [Spodoptera frugiperda]
MTASLVEWSQVRLLTEDIGFDSRVGQSITGLFSGFRRFLRGSMEAKIVPSIWQKTHIIGGLLHWTYHTGGEKTYNVRLDVKQTTTVDVVRRQDASSFRDAS